MEAFLGPLMVRRRGAPPRTIRARQPENDDYCAPIVEGLRSTRE
jgi:hypothetical protein